MGVCVFYSFSFSIVSFRRHCHLLLVDQTQIDPHSGLTRSIRLDALLIPAAANTLAPRGAQEPRNLESRALRPAVVVFFKPVLQAYGHSAVGALKLVRQLELLFASLDGAPRLLVHLSKIKARQDKTRQSESRESRPALRMKCIVHINTITLHSHRHSHLAVVVWVAGPRCLVPMKALVRIDVRIQRE